MHSPDPNIASAVHAVVVHTAQQGFIHGPYVVLAKHAVRAASHAHPYGYAHPARARKHRMDTQCKMGHSGGVRQVVNFRSCRKEQALTELAHAKTGSSSAEETRGITH